MDKKIITIPNIISFFRLLLIPMIFKFCYFDKNYTVTLIIFILSSLTDILDGFIARKFNMISKLGKALDPIVDKAIQFVLFFCLANEYSTMKFILILFIIKESIMSLLGLLSIKNGIMEGAEWYGKLSTVMLFFIVSIHLLYGDLSEQISILLTITVSCFMLLSLILYIMRYIRKYKKISNIL